MNIGENISNLRKAHNLTQEELANLINVSDKTISSYETNRSVPSIEILILLAKVFNTNINEILGLNSNNAEELNKIYEKKNLKDNIIKFALIFGILIVPVFFFWYAGYVSIAAYTARLYAFPEADLLEVSHSTFRLFSNLTIEYIIYLVIMLIIFILYKKKFKKTLIVLSSMMIILVGIDLITTRYAVDLLIFIFAGIVGLISAIKIIPYKKA